MEHPTEDGSQPGTGVDAWYVRAGRKVKKGARRALVPVAIALGVAGSGIAGFEACRLYYAWQYGVGQEETLLEQRVEVKVTRKDGRLYYHQKQEVYRQLDTSALKKQLVDRQNPYGI